MRRSAGTSPDYPSSFDPRMLAKYAGVDPRSVLSKVDETHRRAINGRAIAFIAANPTAVAANSPARTMNLNKLVHRFWDAHRHDVIDADGKTTIEKVLSNPAIPGRTYALDGLFKVLMACGNLRQVLERQREEIDQAILELECLEAVR